MTAGEWMDTEGLAIEFENLVYFVLLPDFPQRQIDVTQRTDVVETQEADTRCRDSTSSRGRTKLSKLAGQIVVVDLLDTYD